MQLREVGPGRGHLLTEVAATFTFMCVDVEPGMRTAAATVDQSPMGRVRLVLSQPGEDCCCCSVGSRRQNITACTGVIFARKRVFQQYVLLLFLLLRALQHHEEVVVHRKPSDRVVGGAGLCE